MTTTNYVRPSCDRCGTPAEVGYRSSSPDPSVAVWRCFEHRVENDPTLSRAVQYRDDLALSLSPSFPLDPPAGFVAVRAAIGACPWYAVEDRCEPVAEVIVSTLLRLADEVVAVELPEGRRFDLGSVSLSTRYVNGGASYTATGNRYDVPQAPESELRERVAAVARTAAGHVLRRLDDDATLRTGATA